MDYYPDKWVVLKVTQPTGEVWYRVFASWYGGYTGADSWKLNSGITKAELKDPSIMFHGTSGSIYYCHKNSYGMSGYSTGVHNGMTKEAERMGAKVEVMPKETDWLNMEWT